MEALQQIVEELQGQVELLRQENSVLTDRLNQASDTVSRMTGGAGGAGFTGAKKERYYSSKMGKHHQPSMYNGKEKVGFQKWIRTIKAILNGHGFRFVTQIFEWIRQQKDTITTEKYNEYCLAQKLTDDENKEHEVLNGLLRDYLEMYSDGEAGQVVMSLKGEFERNGVEALRKMLERYDPKTKAGAMRIQKQAMKMVAAKNHEDIQANIELEDLERQYTEHHPNKKGFDEMTKVCILYQILPTSISEHLLLELRNEEQDPTYDMLKKGWSRICTFCPEELCQC